MKNKISATIAVTFLLVTVAAFAANFTDDTLQIGKPGSSADKSVVFGASNKKKLSHKPSTQTLDYEGNNLSVGDGLNTSDKTLKLNKGANSPTLRHNFTSGDLEIENAPVLNQKGNTVSVGDGTNTNKVLKFNKGASSPEIRYNSTTGKLQFTNDTTTYKDIGSGSGGGGGTNLLQEFNSDFEAGSPPQNWTASGGTFITETADPLFGLQSGSWDSSASAQTLSSQLVTIEKGFIGKKCTADIEYKWPSGVASDLSFQVVDQVPNVLATVALEPTTGLNTRKAFLAFDCPTVATDQLRVRLLSNVANPALIVVDNAFVGVNKSTVNVSQATLIGEARFAATASCIWPRSTIAQGPFSAVAACPGPTVVTNPGPGTILTTDANLPQVTIQNLPPGIYEVSVGGQNTNSAGAFSTLSLFDGTTRSGRIGAGDSTSATSFRVVGVFTYTASGTRTFELHGGVTAGTNNVFASESGPENDLHWVFKRYPLNNAEALNLETTGISWSGYHDSTCSWSRTNTSYGDFTADASCAIAERTNAGFGTVTTSGSVLPAIVFTPKITGRYFISATINGVQCGSTGASYRLRLNDLSNVEVGTASAHCTSGGVGSIPVKISGIYDVSSISSRTIRLQGGSSSGAINLNGVASDVAIEWTVFPISQNFPAPVFTELQNKINATASGVRHFGARVVCSNSASSVITQDGTDIASITNGVSAGNCTINFASAYTQIPSCVCIAVGGTGNYCQYSSPATTSYGFQNVIGGNATNGTIHLLCTGK